MIISGSIGAFVLLSGLPVTDVVFWRCLIGALTLLVFIVLSRQPFSRLTRFTLALAVIGGAALVVNWLLLFAAYSRISISMATVVYNTQPFMLVLMGMVLGTGQRREMGMVTAGLWRRSDPVVERADACTREGLPPACCWRWARHSSMP